jgi:hypothetical protein
MSRNFDVLPRARCRAPMPPVQPTKGMRPEPEPAGQGEDDQSAASRRVEARSDLMVEMVVIGGSCLFLGALFVAMHFIVKFW